MGAQGNDFFTFQLVGNTTATEFNFGEVGMVNPGKRQTLASAPTASQLVSRLTENLIVRFQAPAAGVLDLRQADGGLMQLMNAEGETVTGTSTTQFALPHDGSELGLYLRQSRGSTAICPRAHGTDCTRRDD